MGAGKRSALVAGVLGMTLTVWARLAPGLAAAETAWVQIEALPTLDQAQARLRDLAASFPDAAGFALPGGWYGLALGPYDSPEIAAEALRQMRNAGLIPPDSYVADATRYRAQFWPPEAAESPALSAPSPAPSPEPAPELVAEPAPPPVETLADARRAEEAMGREGRMQIQEALEWVGVYRGGVDGAFGRGTRAAIAAFQQSHGFEPTGVLKSTELRQLLDGVTAEKSALGLTPFEETKAGIAIDLPLGLVEFDHYDPPFVHYRAKGNSGVRILLISEPGERKPFGAVASDGSESFNFLRNVLPGIGGCLHGASCTYDNTVDEDFIIDTLPGRPDTLLITGLSGHGFKFAPVLGEIASQFAQGEAPSFNLAPFSLARFNA